MLGKEWLQMERNNVFHIINQTSRQISKSFNEQLVPKGLYMAQWAVIRYIMRKGPSTQKQICDYLHVEAPTMTRTLNRMEELGLVEKTESLDRRSKIIRLTKQAAENYPKWEKEVDAFENPVTGTLTDDELATTIQTLKKIIDRLQ